MEEFNEDEDLVKPEKNRFPYCIVWVPIPILSWLFPYIGHVGICTSDGVIYDFSGPYSITKDDLLFGRPVKYIQMLNYKIIGKKKWDEAILQSNEIYSKKMHDIICQNCHHHVVKALNIMEYNGKSRHGIIKLGWDLFFKGKWVNCGGFLKTFLPTIFCFVCLLVILIILIIVIVVATK